MVTYLSVRIMARIDMIWHDFSKRETDAFNVFFAGAGVLVIVLGCKGRNN